MKLTVKTFDGTIANKSDCKLIQGQYYKKGEQCFLMPDNKWHRINNGKITHDYRLNKKVFINESLASGIVGKENDGSVKFGYFSPDPTRDVEIIIKKRKLLCLNEDFLDKDNLSEDLSSGTLFYNDEVSDETKKRALIKRCDKRYNLLLDYRCNGLLNTFTNAYNERNKKAPVDSKKCSELPPLTFGIEYETENGFIPERHIYSNGLIPVRDGSLKNKHGEPYEYATIILSGEDGISAIKNQCSLLQKYCDNGYKNSLHIHVGGIPVSKEYLVSIYTLSFYLQYDIYSLFPESYMNTAKFKKRDYNMQLPHIMEEGDEFNSIFKYLSMGEKFTAFGLSHPADKQNNAKWNVETRYHIINFTTLVFNKNETVEFRIHPSTFNQDKIINWIFITLAICQYAYIHKDDKDIANLYKRLTLKDVIFNIYKDKSIVKTLSSYIDFRRILMNKHKDQGDIIGIIDAGNEHEIMNEFYEKYNIERLS